MCFKIAAGLLILCFAITLKIVETTSLGANLNIPGLNLINPGNGNAKDSRSKDCDSKGSRSKSNDDDDIFCKLAIPSVDFFNAKYTLCKGNNPLPTCTCGSAGDISQIQIYNSVTKKNTTIQLCTGCTGSQVPLDKSSTCGNVPTIFRSYFNNLCSTLFTKCKKTITFYTCRCLVATTSRILATTAKVPATTAKVPVTTAKVPATTAKALVTTAKVPVTTANVPVTTAKVPATSANVVPTTANAQPVLTTATNDKTFSTQYISYALKVTFDTLGTPFDTPDPNEL